MTAVEGRGIWRVVLAADPDLSLTETLGLVEAEDEQDAIRDVVRCYHSPSPHDLAQVRGWSPLADGEVGGPLIYAECLFATYMAGTPGWLEDALEGIRWALGDMRPLQALDEHALDVLSRALLQSFGVPVTLDADAPQA